jgi:NarL family two-component system sensor histidine kinase LiaS
MTTRTQSVSCFADERPEKFVEILEQLSDPVAIHDVVCDSWGAITDSTLCWWNEAFSAARVHRVDHGDSMMSTYVDSHVALAHVTEAWNTGESLQFFHIGEETKSCYVHPEADVDIFVRWKRIGDHIVEWSSGTDEMLALRSFVKDQESLVAIASRKRALAIERERIARNLHDVVIQNLYATSLSLSVAGRQHSRKVQEEFNKAISSLEAVIAGIRNEILNVESQKVSQLRVHLEDCLIPLIDHAQAGFDLSIEVPTLPSDVQAHVRAVCMEATSNAIRHGAASFIRIRLTRFSNQLILTIADNGSGISPESQLRKGLHNMRERALSLGGNMEIHTQPETGTIISWSIPYPRWQS